MTYGDGLDVMHDGHSNAPSFPSITRLDVCKWDWSEISAVDACIGGVSSQEEGKDVVRQGNWRRQMQGAAAN